MQARFLPRPRGLRTQHRAGASSSFAARATYRRAKRGGWRGGGNAADDYVPPCRAGLEAASSGRLLPVLGTEACKHASSAVAQERKRASTLPHSPPGPLETTPCRSVGRAFGPVPRRTERSEDGEEAPRGADDYAAALGGPLLEAASSGRLPERRSRAPPTTGRTPPPEEQPASGKPASRKPAGSRH